MKRLVSFSACLLLAAGAAFAQRGGMGGRGSGFGGARGGFGGMPRGGFGGGFNRGFGGGFGGSRFTIGPNFSRFGGFEHHRFFSTFSTFGRFGRNRFGFFPFAYYPLFWGNYGMYDPYGYGYGAYGAYPYAQPNVTVVYPEQAVAPQVIYTQPVVAAPAHPVIRECCEEPPNSSGLEPAAGAREHSPLYLIAMKDGIIRAALAYWVEDGSLHYVGSDHVNHAVKLSEIDRAFSQQLNRERRVPFQLEQAPATVPRPRAR